MYCTKTRFYIWISLCCTNHDGMYKQQLNVHCYKKQPPYFRRLFFYYSYFFYYFFNYSEPIGAIESIATGGGSVSDTGGGGSGCVGSCGIFK